MICDMCNRLAIKGWIFQNNWGRTYNLCDSCVGEMTGYLLPTSGV